MQTKTDFRIRKLVGKQVRIVYQIEGTCEVSIMGQLIRNRHNRYSLLPKGVMGGEYCFFKASDIVGSMGVLANVPAFRMRNLKFAK